MDSSKKCFSPVKPLMEFTKEISRFGTEETSFLTAFCVALKPFFTVRSTLSATRRCLMLLSQTKTTDSKDKQRHTTAAAAQKWKQMNHKYSFIQLCYDEGQWVKKHASSWYVLLLRDKAIWWPTYVRARILKSPKKALFSPKFLFKKELPSGCL